MKKQSWILILWMGLLTVWNWVQQFTLSEIARFADGTRELVWENADAIADVGSYMASRVSNASVANLADAITELADTVTLHSGQIYVAYQKLEFLRMYLTWKGLQ